MDEYYKNCKCPDCTAKRLDMFGGLYGPVESSEDYLKRIEAEQKISKLEQQVLAELSKIAEESKEETASTKQVGGEHYKNFVIQPSEFIHLNSLGWCEGNAIKYICRYKFKNGAEDIKKAIHYLELILQWVYKA